MFAFYFLQFYYCTLLLLICCVLYFELHLLFYYIGSELVWKKIIVSDFRSSSLSFSFVFTFGVVIL